MHSTEERTRYRTEYHIVKSWSTTILASKVNKLLADGWQVSGGIAHDGEDYSQALTKQIPDGTYRVESWG